MVAVMVAGGRLGERVHEEGREPVSISTNQHRAFFLTLNGTFAAAPPRPLPIHIRMKKKSKLTEAQA